MKRSPLARSRVPMTRRAPLRRATPLRSKPSGRARPDEPLATWCTARLPGYCTGRATDRHHILPRAAGGSDDVSNTADCCSACHLQGIHGRPEWAYANGWLRRRAA